MSIFLHIFVFMKEKELLKFYYMGWDLNQDEQPFPIWFEFGYEKIACLLGFNDFEIGLSKEKEEILKEIYAIIK